MVLTPLFCMGTCDMAFHGRMMETRATWPAQPPHLSPLCHCGRTPQPLCSRPPPTRPTIGPPRMADRHPICVGTASCLSRPNTAANTLVHLMAAMPSPATTADHRPHEPSGLHAHVPTFFKKNCHLFITER